MDKYFGTLLSADPDFFTLARPTTLQATQSTPNTPTQIAKTLYPNINDPHMPPPNLQQFLPAHSTKHKKPIFHDHQLLFSQILLLDKFWLK